MMNDVCVVREQIYRNVQTGAVAQIRQELSDVSVEWERPNGSVWDGQIDDPASAQLKPAKPADRVIGKA